MSEKMGMTAEASYDDAKKILVVSLKNIPVKDQSVAWAIQMLGGNEEPLKKG
jgi:hypothetical protein